jgi:hypothetical protein
MFMHGQEATVSGIILDAQGVTSQHTMIKSVVRFESLSMSRCSHKISDIVRGVIEVF